MKVSFLMPVCEQRDEPRLTLQSAKEAAEGLDMEYLVSDEHSKDGGCHDLPKDVLLIKPHGVRDGVSAARRRLFKASRGDVIIWADPHCRFPRGSFKTMVDYCMKRGGIIEANSHPTPNARIRSGRLILSERGLRVARAYDKAATYPALYGTVYVMQRKLYEMLGGWPKLPGIWGYSEQAMTLMSWFADQKIRVMEDIVCIHKSPGKHFNYSVSRGDAARNALFVHAAFFPRSYKCFWEPILRTHPKWAGSYDAYAECLKDRRFKYFCREVEKRRHRQEEQFFRSVLLMEPPEGMGTEKPEATETEEHYLRAQERRSGGKEYVVVHARVNRAINWANEQAPFKGLRVLDVGTRDGYALSAIDHHGASYSEGLEFSRKSSKYAKEQGRNVFRGDMRAMLHKDGAFDYVTCQHVLEHCLEPEKGISELFRVVRPGGHVLLVVPMESRTKDSLHYAIYPSQDHLRKFVTKTAGCKFSIVAEHIGVLKHGLREMMMLLRKEV